MSALAPLGYIGLGHMGGPMAMRLAQAGYPLHIWARNPKRLEPVVAAGAVACASPREVAERSQIVFLCVTDTAAVEAIALGEEGVGAGGHAGGVLVDMSTIVPGAAERLAAELEGRCGMSWIDAPVSGGPPAARAGTLAIMAGGKGQDIEAVRPVVAHLGRITRMGPVGAGQKTKVINQILVFCGMAMVAEAFGLAARAGLDLPALPIALAGGRADSRMLQDFWPRLVAGDFAPTSSVRSAAKDLVFVQALGRQVNAFLPFTGLVAELNQSLIANGFAEEDINAIYRLFRPNPPAAT
jgi:3-hydroxyisobutyrate dehydrogenase